MASSITYEPSHQPAVLSFFDDVPFKQELWHWQFEASPGALSAGFNPVVMEDEHGIVGFNGVMPVAVKFGDETLDALWSCDFYVAARARGQGIGQAIKRELIEKVPVVMSFGVSRQAAIVLAKMGWVLSPDVQAYRKISSSRSLKQCVLRCIQFANRILSPVRDTYSGKVDITWALPASDEVDRLWESCAASYEKAVHRHYDYLDWRYQKHPMARYQFMVARSGEGKLDAILVIREHQGVLRIVDYVGPGEAAGLMKALVQEVDHQYSSAHLRLVTTSERTLGRVLRSQGYCKGRARPALYVRANLAGTRAPETGWFVMAGDSDGEILRAAREHWLAQPQNASETNTAGTSHEHAS